MTYLWFKSLHVVAVLLFAWGLILLAVVTSGLASVGGLLLPHEKRLGNAVLQWDRCVTVPSMAAVWAMGLGLAAWGGWMGQSWLTGKIVFVVALSGLHGILSATLRRYMESATVDQSTWLRNSPLAVATFLATIAGLVTLKP